MSIIHPSELNIEEGIYLVKLARKAIEEYLSTGRRIKITDIPSDKLLRPGMAFTTLEKIEQATGKTSLRGCIGFLSPIQSLIDSVIESAIEAAVGDPRFTPVDISEMDSIIVEVTILSEPVKIEVNNRYELPKRIIIGKHGLIIEKGWFKGTLLPVVPIEYCWDEETFLAETCLKAGLKPDCWLDSLTKVYYYEGRVFREALPRGSVHERDMSKEYRELCLGENPLNFTVLKPHNNIKL
ncbi:MAG: TIGR00296 family protein [Desulfurococcaceae archaeon]